MRKIKYEEYDEDDLREILPHLREDITKVAVTEHFLEKIAHRKLNQILVVDTLENVRPERIEKFPDSRFEFELEFANNLIIIITLIPPKTVAILSAFKKIKMGG
ncbi:hypothetical protein [Methanobrevibacter sp.]